MKYLIGFSLKRRFFNKMAILLNVLLLALMGGLLFADKLVLIVNPELFAPLRIYVDADLWENRDFFSLDGTLGTIKPLGDETLTAQTYRLYEDAGTWVVESQYAIGMTDLQKLKYLIQDYQKNVLLAENDPDLNALYAQLNEPVIVNRIINGDMVIDSGKQNLMFMVITAIYFMMLSFSTMIANEVVYEKTSKILELILTSVSAKTHFLSKMFIGWLTVATQTLLTVVIAGFWLLVRQVYDSGYGLIAFAVRLGIIDTTAVTFRELLIELHFDNRTIGLLLIALLFLFLGILFLQMIMVIVSSFVTSIEESSNIQSPCYLILLAVYYFTLSVNDPYQMTSGIGYYLSFVPFFSMLFMPCRMMIETVSAYELVLSMTLAVLAILLVIDFGSAWYKNGILDNRRAGKKSDHN